MTVTKEQDSIDAEAEVDGYEQDIESRGGEQDQEHGKEVDIGWEWGFESVTSLSTRVFLAPCDEE